MNTSKIKFKKDGWIVLQDANAKKHILEIIALAENGQIVEIRKRHNDGEEEKITKAVNPTYSLPMSVEKLEELLEADKIVW